MLEHFSKLCVPMRIRQRIKILSRYTPKENVVPEHSNIENHLKCTFCSKIKIERPR